MSDMYRGVDGMLPSERVIAHKTNLLLTDLLNRPAPAASVSLTKREYFAGSVLQGFCSHPTMLEGVGEVVTAISGHQQGSSEHTTAVRKALAIASVGFADALLTALGAPQ
jgi:hypothetical protein